MDSQNPDEDKDQKYGSPTSTLSSGWGDVYGNFPQGGETSPEVMIDSSPLALSALEAAYKRRHLEERDPKYPVICDDIPKIVAPPETPIQSETTTAEEHTPGAEEHTPGAEEHTPAAEEQPVKDGKICGLTRKMFSITLAVVLVVIIAAAVGGGVGGSAASSKSKNPTPAGR
jgi:hypothetical protein